MNIYLDFETFWDSASGYTLSKLSTEEYVRDPRFKALLLAVAVDDGPIMVYEEEDIATVLRQLPLDDPANRVFAVNMAFDGFIVSDHFKVKIANPICTRALCRLTGVSRLGGESLAAMNEFFKYGTKKAGTVVSDGKLRKDFTQEEWDFFKAYNADDVDQLRHHVQEMLPHVHSDMLDFDGIAENLYIDPQLELDQPLLQDYAEELIANQDAAMQRLQHLFNFPDRDEFLKAIRSRTRFPQMLEELGAEVPVKVSEAREKSVQASLDIIQSIVKACEYPHVRAMVNTEQREFHKHQANIKKGVLVPALAKNDLGFMALMDSDDDDVALLARVRAEANTSISLSRCNKFLSISSRGKLPVALAAYGAVTGRFTGTNAESSTKSDATNLQNLNARTGDTKLRQSIVAPPGYMIIAADSEQIEARVNAWVSGQMDLVEVFARGGDPYAEFAHDLYPQYTIAEIHSKAKSEWKRARDVGKEGILSLGYNAGGEKFSQRLKQVRIRLDADDAVHLFKSQEAVSLYRHKYPYITRNWKVNGNVLSKMSYGDSGKWGGPNDDLFEFNGRDKIFGRRCATVTLPDGFKLYYPNLRWDKEERQFYYDSWDRKLRRMVAKKIYGGLLTNNTIQGLAAAIIRWQMNQIGKVLRIVLQVHDEIVCIAPIGSEAMALEYMLSVMKTAPPWLSGGESLPLSATGGFGRCYGDVK